MTVLYRWIDGKRYGPGDTIPRVDKRSSLPRPMIVRDYEAYECPVTGKMIEGRHAHSENLKRTDCRILEKGEKEDKQKNARKEVDAKLDKAVDKAVDEVARDLLV